LAALLEKRMLEKLDGIAQEDVLHFLSLPVSPT
jgi:hypothetical protein